MSLKRSRTSDDLCKMCPLNTLSFILLLFFSSAGGDIVPFGSNGECFGPGGMPGVCRNLKECKPLFNLLVKGKSRPGIKVIEFLWNSHCGFEGNDPVVCCPVSAKPKDIHEVGNLLSNNPGIEKFLNQSCGHIQTLDRVVGGSVTAMNEFPWMALINYKTGFGPQFRCGGSLISPRYVLTAAHCVTNLKDMTPTTVRLGEYDLEATQDCEKGKGCNPRPKDIEVEELIPHPDYFKPQLRNDIALIKLRKKVEIGKWIRPICLPLEIGPYERNLSEGKAVVAGWGATDSGTNSNILQKVTLPIVSLNECSKVYKRKIPVTNAQICAGGEPGKDSCSGDSGGPLQIIELNASGEPVYVQHGIVSFGPRYCGSKGFPGVYTRVSHYTDWILSNVKD